MVVVCRSSYHGEVLLEYQVKCVLEFCLLRPRMRLYDVTRISSIIIFFFDNFIFFFAAGPSCAKRREHTLATPNMTPASPRERARDSTTPRTGRRARPLIDLLPLASCREAVAVPLPTDDGIGRAAADR